MVRVSAVIAVYNGASTIDRAIASVLEQDFSGCEIVVVDDGSTDSTVERLQQWGDKIHLVQQPNSGPSSARNNGVRIATGEYAAFLDADDAWLPGKLSRMVGALEGEPDAVLAYSNFSPVDATGGEFQERFFEPNSDHAPSMEELLTRWWPILTSTVVMRRDTFQRCGGFSEEFRSAGYEDPYLWLLAREHGRFLYVNEPLVLYRAENALDRMGKYKPGCAIFARLVRQRYGVEGERLAKQVVHAQVSALSHEGLLAMLRGDRKRARRALMLALRYNPLHMRSVSRLFRTFLPLPLVRALTGRARLQVHSD
jgi:glycosyltransferase involved in cell wall biosynthesis